MIIVAYIQLPEFSSSVIFAGVSSKVQGQADILYSSKIYTLLSSKWCININLSSNECLLNDTLWRPQFGYHHDNKSLSATEKLSDDMSVGASISHYQHVNL